VVLYASVMALNPGGWFDPTGFAVIAWTGAVSAAAFAIREQHMTVAALQERAESVLAARDSEVSRSLAEERVRIARDLHDSVAHSISAIALQAGAADAAVPNDPDTAHEALRDIRSTARTAIAELQEILGVLRSPGDADVPVARTIASILADAQNAGSIITADVTVSGYPEPVQRTLTRILQEALTNARRHGTGAATVLLQERDGHACLTVDNAIAPSRNARGESIMSGYGLIGMRERAATIGGTVTTDVTRNRFTMRACIPIRPDGEPS